jgi:hypothetical protein
MHILLFVAAAFLANSSTANAEWTDGPYDCHSPGFLCVCGHNEQDACKRGQPGEESCTSNSDCYCQANTQVYQYCGHWDESYIGNVFTPKRKNRPPMSVRPNAH